MWKSLEYCDFTLTWDSDHDPNFLSTYTVTQNDDDWNEMDDGIDQPNSSFITCTRNEHSCTLELGCMCKPHHGVSIVGVKVRSQAQTIELYSDIDGYLQTARCKTTDEDGSFCCTAKLENPVNKLDMKFVGLGKKSAIRIYKLHFMLKQNYENKNGINGSTGMIDMSKVKGYLHSMGDTAPEGGTRLLHAVEDYQQSQMSKFGALSSALSSGGADSSSMLSSLLSMVNRSHDFESANQIVPKQGYAPDLTNNHQETKSHDSLNGGPLAAMLMSMSRTQESGQGDSESQGGMFAMLQNICGKVSKLRVAEHAAETGAETQKEDDIIDTKETRVETHPDIGASFEDTVSPKLTGSHTEMLQKKIEQTVSQMINLSEEKIIQYVDTRLNAMETRLNEKLDTLIELLRK
ncbi:uncharacterized protein LOC123546876 [Mercenaria mercenaria]|uniref:uncharacterized protein LOC123546876 n=1 Tax=Mercenaria mercenaria TaxID=6596 RepID=UPI00234F3307|nr:uncharacterized protein LOC123546876 [Mercenaria mercenaria]